MPLLGIDVEARFAQVLEGLTALDRKTSTVARSMETAFNRVRGTLAVFGVGISAAGIIAFAKSAIDSVDALDDLSEKTALTVEFLSKLQEVAIIGGHSLDEVASVASKLAKNVSAANGGNQQLLKFFSQLGISAQELKTQSFDTIFEKFARGIANAPDKLNALAVGAKLAGKSLQEMIPFFNDLNERGLSIKPLVTTEQAAAAERLKKQFAELSLGILAFKRDVSEVLTPVLARLVTAFNNARAGGEGFFQSLARGISNAAGGNVSDAIQDVKLAIIENESALLELRAQRDKADKELQKGGGFLAKNSFDEADRKIKTLERKNAELRKQVAGAELGLRGDERDTKPTNAPVGAVGDEGAAAKAEAAKRAADAALLRLTESRSKIELDIAKQSASDAIEILSRQHAAGLVLEQDFWQKKAAIQQAAVDASIRAADEEVRSRAEALRKANAEAKTDPTKRADAINAERELTEALAKRASIQREGAQQSALLVLEQANSERDYRKQIEDTNIAVLALKGDTLELATARIQAASRAARQAALQRGDEGELRRLDAIEEGAVAQAKLTLATQNFERIRQGLSVTEERINNSQRTGAIGTLEAMLKLGQARSEQLPALQRELAVMRLIAEAGTDESAKIRVKELTLEFERLAASTDVVGEHFKTLFSDTFASELEKVMEGTQSVTEAFGNMSKAIIKEIDRMVIKALANNLFDKMFSKTGGGGSGALDGIASFFSSVFGMAQGGVVGPHGAVSLRRYAAGGVATSPQLAVFGEGSRPEAFVPLPDGRRIPVKMNGGGGVNVVMNISTQDANSFRASRSQILADYSTALAFGRRNT